MTIRIGSKVDTIVAYIVDGIPGDIILGSPFLCKHSEGYRKMLEEFKRTYRRAQDNMCGNRVR